MIGALAVMETSSPAGSPTRTDGRRRADERVVPRGADEVDERPQEAVVPAPHQLVVPLHPRRIAAAVRPLERFDDAVARPDGRDEAGAQRRDPLGGGRVYPGRGGPRPPPR